MVKRTLIALLLTTSTALASDLSLGVKLYKDGLYSLAAKTFRENLNSLKGENFKRVYRFAYLSFLKAKDYNGLEQFVNFWEKNYPEFHRGELLALQTLLALQKGIPFDKAFPLQELKALPIKEKIQFFSVLSRGGLSPEDTYYIIEMAAKDLELKGAVKDSGFLKAALEMATKSSNYQLLDLIFDTYGRWLETPEETVQFIRYLERKNLLQDAVVEAEKLYREHPNQETQLELARAYYLAGDYQKAAELLRNPQSIEGKYLLAWTLYRLGKTEEIPKVIGLNVSKPKEPEELEILEDFYRGSFNLGKLKKLFPELYVKALLFSFSEEIPEVNYGSPHNLGYLYFERGLYNKAQKELEKAIQNPTEKLTTARTLYLLGKLGTLNLQVGNVVYNQLMGNYQNTPYYRASLLNAAKVYLYSGNPALALKLLQFAYSQGNRGKETVKLMGTALFNMKDFKKAADVLKGAEDGESRTLLAFSLYQIGEKNKSFDVLKRELTENGLFPEVNGGRAVFLAKELGRVEELSGLPLTTPVVKTMAAMVSKDVKLAEKLFTSAPQREKITLALFLSKFYEENDPQKAMFYMTQLFNLSPDDETSQFAKQYINYLAYKSGNFEPLLFNDPYFIAYNPENTCTDTATIISKAEDYLSQGQLGKAYGLLQLALQRTTLPELKNRIAERLVEIDLKQKNYSRAQKDAMLATDKNIRNFLLFKTYLSMGRLVDAYTAAQNVKDVNKIPGKERGFFIGKLAHYYKLTGNKEKALELTEELVKNGELPSASYDDLISLGILAQEQGKLDLAEKLINEAMKKAKTKEQRAESLFWRAAVESQKGETDSAIIDYLKIPYEIGVEPWSSTALYRAAQLFEEKGDIKQAIKLYRRVAKMKGGTKEGEIAAEKVKSLLQRLNREE